MRPLANNKSFPRTATLVSAIIGVAKGTETTMKKINTGSSDFSDLRKENVIYVDKTAYMRRLASDKGNKVVFMSRPRRFGKSLSI